MLSDLGQDELYAALAEALADLNETLRRTRNAYALTIRDAAAQIGVAPATVYRVEHGGHCTTDVARRIFMWLAVGTAGGFYRTPREHGGSA